MMSEPVDHLARAQALDTRQSFAVAAPAGSGKTGLLTQRILCLLAEVEVPEQILCMTFTRKAAGEMRHRLIDALLKAKNDAEPEDSYEHQTWTLARRVLTRDKAQNWQLIAAPNRLRILTIDSFCRNLASQLALESGFGDMPEPVENGDPYYRLAIHDLFAELEADSVLGDALGQLLIHLDNDLTRLENLLLGLLSKREQWLPHIIMGFTGPDTSAFKPRHILEQAAQNLIEETLTTATEHLLPVASEIAMLADYAAQHLQDSAPESDLAQCLGIAELPENTVVELKQWLGLADLFLTQKGDWRKTINKKMGFPTKKDSLNPDMAAANKQTWTDICQWCQQQDGLNELLNDVRHLPAAEFSEDQWQVLKALTNTLPQLCARLNLIFTNEGVCDYTEITLAAKTALGPEDDPTDLTLRLDNQIQHILVDEFQDTSSVHFDIFRRLTAGWQANDGRTLFFVGDGMQSLYSFRNANVGLFMDIRQHPLGDIPLTSLDLTVNFRSQANIIAWVNRLFEGAFPAVANTGRGAVPYAHSQAFKVPTEGPAVNIDIFEDDPDGLLEAEQVAQKIIAAQTKNSSGSTAILVRGRNHLRQILPALREHGLAWQATDIDPLANCMPVIDLLSLTRAMLNPADRIAWLAILRAPWCGLSLDDLFHITNTKLPSNPVPRGEHYPLLLNQLQAWSDIAALSVEGQQILQRVAATLGQAWQQRFRKPLRVWLEGLWIELGGPAVLTNEPGTQQSLDQCRQYWDLLESHAQDTCTLGDWSAFESAVERLYAAPTATTDLAAEGVPAIQIMTIHKAKGLEFDTVILPGLDRRTRGDDTELLRWRERVAADGRTQLLMSPPQKLGAAEDQTYAHLKREASLKSRLENTRVLYVACTRAIKHLHLLFRQTDKAPTSNSLLAALWPTLKIELEEPGPEAQITYHLAQTEDIDQASTAGNHQDSTLTNLANTDPVNTDPANTNPDNTDPENIAPDNIDPDSSHRFQWRLPPDWQCPASQPGKSSFDPNLHGSAPGENTHTAMEPEPVFNSENEIPGTSDNDPDTADNNARKIGIIFHCTLQYMVADGLEQWQEGRILRQQQVWQQQLTDQHIVDTEAAMKKLTTALSNCLSDTNNSWIFDQNHEDSACELALGYIDYEGKARTAIVDRTFIINGERWIIDYKLSQFDADHSNNHPAHDKPANNHPASNHLTNDSNARNKHISLDDFILRQKQQYTPQLRHYANLFSQMGPAVNQQASHDTRPLTIKTALYFPLYSRLELVDIGNSQI